MSASSARVRLTPLDHPLAVGLADGVFLTSVRNMPKRQALQTLVKVFEETERPTTAERHEMLVRELKGRVHELSEERDSFKERFLQATITIKERDAEIVKLREDYRLIEMAGQLIGDKAENQATRIIHLSVDNEALEATVRDLRPKAENEAARRLKVQRQYSLLEQRLEGANKTVAELHERLSQVTECFKQKEANLKQVIEDLKIDIDLLKHTIKDQKRRIIKLKAEKVQKQRELRISQKIAQTLQGK